MSVDISIEAVNQARSEKNARLAERSADVGRRAQIVEQQGDIAREINELQAESFEFTGNRQWDQFSKASRKLSALRNEAQLLDIGLRHFDIYRAADSERNCLEAELAERRATWDAEVARRDAHSEAVMARLAAVAEVAGEIQLADGLGEISAAHEDLTWYASQT
jgi:hypothetical protein